MRISIADFRLQLLEYLAEAIKAGLLEEGTKVEYSRGSKTKGITFTIWFREPSAACASYVLPSQHGIDMYGVYETRDAYRIVQGASLALAAANRKKSRNA